MGKKRRDSHPKGSSASDAEPSATAARKVSDVHWWSGIVVLLLAVAAALFIVRSPAGSYIYGPRDSRPDDVHVWAPATSHFSGLLTNVTCSKKLPPREGPSADRCADPARQGRCARFVVDGALPEEEVRALQSLVSFLFGEVSRGWGAPSVVDLQSNAISYQDSFVDLKLELEQKGKQIPQEMVDAYHSVRRKLRRLVAELFGLDGEVLKHSMAFFNQINGSLPARTLHDEYWHKHVDTEQYETFAYTTLLYLATEGEHFEGGSFMFGAPPGGDRAEVQPRLGRVLVFTSGSENPHWVRKVTSGVRLVLTSAFTCHASSSEMIREEAAKLPWYMDQ